MRCADGQGGTDRLAEGRPARGKQGADQQPRRPEDPRQLPACEPCACILREGGSAGQVGRPGSPPLAPRERHRARQGQQQDTRDHGAAPRRRETRVGQPRDRKRGARDVQPQRGDDDPPADGADDGAIGDGPPTRRKQREDDSGEQQRRERLQKSIVHQRRPMNRRGEEERDLGIAERQRRALSRPDPAQRERQQEAQRGERGEGRGRGGPGGPGERGGAAARVQTAEEQEVEVGGAGDAAGEIPGLLQPREPGGPGVEGRHDAQIRQGAGRVRHGAMTPRRPWRG